MESEGISKEFCIDCVHRDVCKYKEEYLQAYDYYTNIVIRQFPWSVTNITEVVKPHFSLKCREFIRDI